MPEPAFLLMIVSRTIPDKVWEVLQLLITKVPQPGKLKIRGLRQALLIESQEEPGKLIWLTTWNTKADSQAFLSSAVYTDLIANLHRYLLRQPEWYWYSLLADRTFDAQQMMEKEV